MSFRTSLAAALLLLGSVPGPLAVPQTAAAAADRGSDPRQFDATQFGEDLDLGPDWLFKAGDNPAYASPSLDDGSWKTISTRMQLPDYGIRDIAYAWYRIHIRLRPGTRDVMVGVQGFAGQYEIYGNGIRLGAWGSMTDRRTVGHNSLFAYSVPDSLIAADGQFLLAVRVALNPTANRGRGASTPIGYGTLFLIGRDAAPRYASYVAAHRSGPALLACGLALVVCLISCALYFALRGSHEYLAISVLLLSAGIAAAIAVWMNLVAYTVPGYVAMYSVLAIENFALIEFVRLVLRLRRGPWLLALEIVSSLAFVFDGTQLLGIFSPYVYLAGFFVPVLTVKFVLPALLIRGWRQGNREALLLFPAIFIGCFADYWDFVRNVAYYAHLPIFRSLGFSVSVGSYSIDLWRLGDFAFYIALLLFLVLRTVRIARERALASAELEAARTVQQVLIPEAIPSIPGFLLHSVYKPAGQVGGDFFQIMPVRGDGVLIVIGDVSGKGMPAAMTVSLLVGTVRTLAHYTQSPGEILAAMNMRMLARSSGGFTTCLALRADAGGNLTVANAGHIPPYLAGKEMTLENGLPLGLSADTAYAEATFHLAAGEQLTLLTDGVVEARDKSGELFGFERTSVLSSLPAEDIARAAEEFGQDDDITALTLARTA